MPSHFITLVAHVKVLKEYVWYVWCVQTEQIGKHGIEDRGEASEEKKGIAFWIFSLIVSRNDWRKKN